MNFVTLDSLRCKDVSCTADFQICNFRCVQGRQVPLTPDELSEARVRLVVGLKRYFHGKRMEGLLSSRVQLPSPLLLGVVMRWESRCQA